MMILAAMFLSSYSHIDKEDATKSIISKENLVRVLNDLEVQHVDIVFAQALLESAEFKSNVFKTRNNLFGMKVPGKRPTVASNVGKKGYAHYDNWVQSVEDYRLYQNYVTKNKDLSRSQYLSIIAKSYSQTSDYVTRLNRVIKQNKKYFQI